MTPSNVYPAYLQVIMYTLIPVGLIGSLPVGVIKNFTLEGLLLLAGGVFLFPLTAKLLFYKGLTRYSSGSYTGFRAD